MENLKIEVARIRKFDGEGSLKAFADIVIGGSFLVRGLKIVEGKNGIFVGMPREQGKDGKWYDNVLPITKEAKEELAEVLLGAYEA
ncbi:MAG: septation protein spoVG [Candidatus Omnitrophica bacterium CG07_land_8_20_14_0_80_42_15]|uniref:Septation protein spoVG n=1 Tax=Candidatus Aquitaenariimonas noxiae TaxID=1974741 RepID=A0A2J0KZ79_9BACT|nr:MAG: septation protein spoVG [Candidatus Omnitrophica bacterium CG07_land_8_20_14_0_80_42_15]